MPMPIARWTVTGTDLDVLPCVWLWIRSSFFLLLDWTHLVLVRGHVYPTFCLVGDKSDVGSDPWHVGPAHHSLSPSSLGHCAARPCSSLCGRLSSVRPAPLRSRGLWRISSAAPPMVMVLLCISSVAPSMAMAHCKVQMAKGGWIAYLIFLQALLNNKLVNKMTKLS
jgi:hypothetical protein